MYKCKNPVLFITFNRPDTTKKVFDEIAKAKPPKLYVATDGPRVGNENDLNNISKVKEIVKNITWPCQVFTLYRENNLGCKYAVSSAIDWFFANEEMGMILEDDCLPNNDFFYFCDEMLLHYKDDHRIRFIAGSNFQQGIKRGDASYYFSKLSHVWGWASWRRVWNDYDVELSRYKNCDVEKEFSKIFHHPILIEDWTNTFRDLVNNKINTWDYQLSIINMFNNGLSIMPNVNLISNIGFGFDATHTFSSNGFDSLPLNDLSSNMVHPNIFVADYHADLYTLYREHFIERRQKKSKFKFLKKLKFWKKKI